MSELSFIIRKRWRWGEGGPSKVSTKPGDPFSPRAWPHLGQRPAVMVVAWPILEDKGRVWAVTGQAKIFQSFLISLTFLQASLQPPLAIHTMPDTWPSFETHDG